MDKNLYQLLCCPHCKNKLRTEQGKFYCKNCKQTYRINDGIPDFSYKINESGMKLSQKKWDEKYRQDTKKNIVRELDFLDNKFFSLVWNQIKKNFELKKKDIFLEIGCGTFYFGRHLAKLGYTVVGIDMSIEALKLAQSVFTREGIKNYLLVCGNVLNMPFKENSIDMLYGAGVIEHFPDTFSAVKELQRVLKKGGVAYNTVPYLNIGSLTYRQVWGNIPRLPVLEELFTFIHTEILGARHMRFGYELSFTRSYLEKIHRQAGFSTVKTGQFECELDFDYLKNKSLRRMAISLSKNSPLFWPMIYVAGKK